VRDPTASESVAYDMSEGNGASSGHGAEGILLAGHEGRLQRLEGALNECDRKVTESTVKLDVLSSRVESHFVHVAGTLAEIGAKMDAQHDDISSVKSNIGVLTAAKAKTAFQTKKVKTAAATVAVAGLGALAHHGAEVLWAWLTR
jgi:hypothetical protein